MRTLLAASTVALLAACSGGGEEAAANNAAAQAPPPSGPPPLTPTLNVTAEPGNSAAWMDAPSNAGDPSHAPYGNLLDQPVVDAPGKTK